MLVVGALVSLLIDPMKKLGEPAATPISAVGNFSLVK